MSRQKRISKALEKAEMRSTGLTSISSTLDLGNNLTLAAYSTMIADTRAKLEHYNKLLSEVDAASNALQQAEKNLSMLTEQMLMGVAVKYGKDSTEYEMAGGVRKSERKRPTRKPAPSST